MFSYIFTRFFVIVFGKMKDYFVTHITRVVRASYHESKQEYNNWN